jgi:hypothetical protein
LGSQISTQPPLCSRLPHIKQTTALHSAPWKTGNASAASSPASRAACARTKLLPSSSQTCARPELQIAPGSPSPRANRAPALSAANAACLPYTPPAKRSVSPWGRHTSMT